MSSKPIFDLTLCCLKLLFSSENDSTGLWKDDSFNKRKIKLKSKTSYSLAALDFKDEVKLFQSFQIAKLFLLQFLLILYRLICEVYYINHSWRLRFQDVAMVRNMELWGQFFKHSVLPLNSCLASFCGGERLQWKSIPLILGSCHGSKERTASCSPCPFLLT